MGVSKKDIIKDVLKFVLDKFKSIGTERREEYADLFGIWTKDELNVFIKNTEDCREYKSEKW